MIERSVGLATDLYELTMAAAYFDNGLREKAVFELFVRKLPQRRSYLIAAGLEQALDHLQGLRFTADEIAYLREHDSFAHVSAEFFDYLGEFRFTGDAWAVPEGTAVFEMEPILRVSAPVIEAQVVETFLLATINFQTLIASKAARVVTAARGRSVIEFGTRRAHGTEAGLMAARAAYVAGCAGTSNVEAGLLFGVPTFGTLAHSFVMLFDDEDDAFRAFLKIFPETATILVDTYDTLAAVERLARDFDSPIPAIRLDSGDLLELSKRARAILDRGGKTETKILASGDLDEFRIEELISRGASIDAFGVGTQLATSYDAPALSGVYKLVAAEDRGEMDLKLKLSPEKATYPGSKQIWRATDEAGMYRQDLIAFSDEPPPQAPATGGGGWRPLLELVMKGGQNINRDGSKEARLARLDQARARAAEELSRLPEELLLLDSAARYEVRMSEELLKRKEELEKSLTLKRP
ncbi:MAG TPA: nicotinate phosphoribosyltransferase [Blastocatellia bacterium]|nr:nicotinate phosphoribosyltransferase [Blastocatellia bacterium]